MHFDNWSESKLLCNLWFWLVDTNKYYQSGVQPFYHNKMHNKLYKRLARNIYWQFRKLLLRIRQIYWHCRKYCIPVSCSNLWKVWLSSLKIFTDNFGGDIITDISVSISVSFSNFTKLSKKKFTDNFVSGFQGSEKFTDISVSISVNFSKFYGMVSKC